MSLRDAINAKCADCIYDPLDNGAGGKLQQIEACGGVNRSLYPVRPKPRKLSEKNSKPVSKTGEKIERAA